MKIEAPQDLHRIFLEDGPRIDAALQRGVRQALLEHQREGRPVVVFRNGKTIWLNLDEIDVK
ncbi:MAG: hypothetical protein ABI634_19405 [Acidobacteriota bacterium]